MTVVVAVKADRRVYRLLRSLLDQTEPRHTYEVIVVENGTSVLTDIRALDAGVVRYLHTPEANAAAARNMVYVPREVAICCSPTLTALPGLTGSSR
jgi:glycosyltransferase involved in cell wall biosynthesis